MTIVLGFHESYEGLGGYKRSELMKTLGEIARANGHQPPREVWGYAYNVERIPAGTILIIARLEHLGTVAGLPKLLRGMIARDIRVFCGGFAGDLAMHLPVLDQLGEAVSALENELRNARAELAEERKERKLLGAHIGASLLNQMALALRSFDVDNAAAYGEQVYKQARQRVDDAAEAKLAQKPKAKE